MKQDTKDTTTTRKTVTCNPYRLTLRQSMKAEGLESPDDALAYVQGCEWEGMSAAMCTEGCTVEPDGRCPHGCPALAGVLLNSMLGGLA